MIITLAPVHRREAAGKAVGVRRGLEGRLQRRQDVRVGLLLAGRLVQVYV
jgi:predicted hotdog family 3-hydroxylacyl-ACP dehydratase